MIVSLPGLTLAVWIAARSVQLPFSGSASHGPVPLVASASSIVPPVLTTIVSAYADGATSASSATASQTARLT